MARPRASRSQFRSLKALVVFGHLKHSELVKSVHVYRVEGGEEKQVEREYLFNNERDYEEIICTYKVFTLKEFNVSQQYQGLVTGIWVCIFVFDVDLDGSAFTLNRNSLLSGNPKLKSIPTLAADLQLISESTNASRVSGNGNNKLGSTPYIPALDLNSLPALDLNSVPALDLNSLPLVESDNEASEQSASDVGQKKKKRVRSDYVAKISLEDVAKHFDVPIVEAAKRLNVGVSVLKKKCRKFGIPRWPHRKLKSLNSLLHYIQEEAENFEADEETREIMAIKERIIKSEKEKIEQRPFMDLQTEMKIIRQDQFKKRHKTRVQEIQSRTINFI